jgi:protein-L-isoaspartate(D-aspartate) O-methyltransferase
MSIAEEQHRLRLQLEERDVRDPRVLDAIERTRREFFMPEEIRSLAYLNDAQPIGYGQSISQPLIVAMMTEALKLTGDETILEIGTGSGYQAAILSQLCQRVVTIERIEELAARARQALAEQGHTNIEFRYGDGTLGCPELGPYDGILVTAAAPRIPEPLYEQLKPGGRLIVPVGDEFAQRLLSIEKRDPEPRVIDLGGCRFVKLIGQAGWPE